MYIAIQVLLFILFCPIANSATFFEYTSDTYLVGHDSKILVDMHYRLEGVDEDAFRVRPVVSSGTSYIYDSEIEDWAPSNASWVDMPKLQREIQVKLAANSKVTVFFEVQNIYSSDIYETGSRIYYPYADLYTAYKNLRLIGTEAVVKKSSLFVKVLKYMNGVFQKI